VRATCSINDLQAALVNVDVVSKSLNVNVAGRIIDGGWIYLQCHPPYNRNSLSGSLNMTCMSTGLWSTPPVCS
jgi:hypothetical protein